ncbi:MAG: hypothetical protein WA117_21385, partial [Verrucomicrobiia bacterium]
VPGCRVWPRAETADAGVYRNVPECELAEAPALLSAPAAVGIRMSAQPYRYPPRWRAGEAPQSRVGVPPVHRDHAKGRADEAPSHARLPYSDNDP